MKHFFVFAIVLYQSIFSILFKRSLGIVSFCRFSPSCSEYAKIMILEHGVFKGGYYSLRRIFSCQPFNNKRLDTSV